MRTLLFCIAEMTEDEKQVLQSSHEFCKKSKLPGHPRSPAAAAGASAYLRPWTMGQAAVSSHDFEETLPGLSDHGGEAAGASSYYSG